LNSRVEIRVAKHTSCRERRTYGVFLWRLILVSHFYEVLLLTRICLFLTTIQPAGHDSDHYVAYWS
jgi:hypothetical protein